VGVVSCLGKEGFEGGEFGEKLFIGCLELFNLTEDNGKINSTTN
jgi:hypothetical protein